METKFRIFLIRYRREISSLLAAIGVLILISIVRSTVPTLNAVIASKPLAAGTTLTQNLITDKKVSRALAWPGLLTKSDLAIGKVTSHAISAGQPISASDLVSSDLLAGFSSNKIAISIPLKANQTEAFLTSGNHINVYAAQAGMAAQLVAFDAIVLFMPEKLSGTFNFGSSGEQSLILAVNQSESASIAAYIGSGTFTFALLPN